MSSELADTGQATTGLVLAGGLARRMGGDDKGLVNLAGRPMIAWVLDRLSPQVSVTLINANRNGDRYADLGCDVVADTEDGFLGPLAGMLSGLQACQTPWMLAVPCDSQLLPSDLAQRLHRGAQNAQTDIAVAHDGERLQPVFALLRTTLREDLQRWLGSGERKIDRWYARCGAQTVDFSDCPQAFRNVNTPEELNELATSLASPG